MAPKCTSTVRLDGKTAVVTGCNTGIGKPTVLELYKRGCKVIMACRDTTKAEAAKNDIVAAVSEQNVGSIVVLELDLSSLESVRNFAAKILESEEQLHLLINNAGVFMTPKSTTKDGFEMQFGTNHLGHFLLTMLLLRLLRRSAPARIVNVSSESHKSGDIDFDDLAYDKKYSPYGAYCRSKLANVLFTEELARLLPDKKVTVYGVHPGVVHTEVVRYMDESVCRGVTFLYNRLLSWFIRSPLEGAQTTLFCAIDETAGTQTGLYYENCAVGPTGGKAGNKEMAQRLWKISKEMVQLGEDKKVTVYGVHPGTVFTEAVRHVDETAFIGLHFLYNLLAPWFIRSPLEGAQTTLYCAIDEKAGTQTGLYYENCGVGPTGGKAGNKELAQQLWKISREMVQLGEDDPFLQQGA